MSDPQLDPNEVLLLGEWGRITRRAWDAAISHLAAGDTVDVIGLQCPNGDDIIEALVAATGAPTFRFIDRAINLVNGDCEPGAAIVFGPGIYEGHDRHCEILAQFARTTPERIRSLRGDTLRVVAGSPTLRAVDLVYDLATD